MTDLSNTFEWSGPSADPNDEQFGDAVRPTTLADAEGGDAAVDAALVGEPFDWAVVGRRGAKRGPSALREQLAALKTHHFDAGPVAGVADLGDVTFEPGSRPQTVAGLQRAVREVTERVHDAVSLPVFLGGDNSLTYPNAAPLLDSGSLGVVNFDAHLDVREVGDDPTSGTPYRQLFDAGLDAYACVGARHFETSAAYADYVRDRGGEVVTAEEVGDGLVGAADRALDAMTDADQIYVSVDADVLDAAHAPGVSAPTPGGLSTRELFRLLRLVAADDRVAGFEVVECAPPLDEGGRTAAAGARAVAHFLSAAAVGGAR